MMNASIERQVKPIYDALETGSNKSAIQACNKVLKKYPNLDLVKALKALAMVRTNKIEETLPLCNEVIASKPTDLDTLNAMMHVLRALGRNLDTITMFTTASSLQPHNEDLAVQSFFANVRAGHWKTAQQIANRMYKQFQVPVLLAQIQSRGAGVGAGGAGESYVYWSAMCAWMQAEEVGSGLGEGMKVVLRKLAHRLIAPPPPPSPSSESTITLTTPSAALASSTSSTTTTTPPPPSPYTSPDRLHLYISLCLALGLHDEALRALDSEEAREIAKVSLAVEELRRRVGRVCGCWESEAERARGVIETGDRDWLLFLSILDATFSSLCVPDLSPPHTTSTSTLAPQPSALIDPHTSTRPPLVFHTFESAEDEARAKGVCEDYVGKTRALLEGVVYGDEGVGEEGHGEMNGNGNGNGNGNVKEGEEGEGEGEESAEGKAKGARKEGVRVAMLALLELEWRVGRVGLSSDKTRLLTLLKTYISKFGDKMCCYEDLKPYTEDLEGETLQSWVEVLRGLGHDYTTISSTTLSINIYKLHRLLLLSSPSPSSHLETELAVIKKYITAYLEALPLGKHLAKTELQPADDLAVLAAQGLVGAWGLSGDVKYLNQAAVVLEYASSKSQHSYAMRVLLIRVYNLLGAPALFLAQYHAMNVKQIQNDTLSHFILSRASTYSTSSIGDLTFQTECLESSQIYISNSTDTADFIVKAFTLEKYSQIPDFIEFEERLDNSLQRDLVKLEHVRMRLTHEPISTDIVDAELIELKFIFDRIHHDNRDFSIIPSYQPRNTPSFNDQTLVFGKAPGLGWLMIFLRIYIRVFSQASDLDDVVEEKLIVGDPPKTVDTEETKIPLKERLPKTKDGELEDLTPEERALFDYAMALCEWLGPYHDYTRPPPSTVLAEAAKHTEGKASRRYVESLTLGEGAVDKEKERERKRSEEPPPAVVEPPEGIAKFFDDMAKRFKEVEGEKELPWKALHVVTLTQEASILLAIITLRFKNQAILKVNKLTALTHSFKELRAKANATLKGMSASLVKIAEKEGTSDRRKEFVESCKDLQPEFDHDYVLNVAKKVTDARKRVVEGIGKGITRVIQQLP